MRNILYFFILNIIVLFAAFRVIAQEQDLDCARNLNEARTAYTDGNLYAIPGKLSDCLNEGFSKTEKVQAYRLLTLTYLNINQQEKARQSLIKLLTIKTDFRVLKNQDPEELYSLYKKIDTEIKYYLGVKIGANTSFIQNNIGLSSTNPLPGTRDIAFRPLLSYQFGGQFIKPLKDFHLQVGLNYQLERYAFQEIIPHINLNGVNSNIAYTGKSQGLNIDLNARYQKNFYEWRPFVEAGITLRGNLNNTITNYTATFSESVEQEIIESTKNNEHTRLVNFGFSAAAGTMIKVSEHYLEIKASATQYIMNHNLDNSVNRGDITVANGGYLMYNNFTSFLLRLDISYNLPFFNFR